ncbi:MAG: type II secretion system protein [Huintestinicola sp.]
MQKIKKLKAFTLIELVVTMVIIAILMACIMRFFTPINDVYSTASVLSNQRATEMSIATYIGENIRFATNIAVFDDKSNADAAVSAFLNDLGVQPTTLDGEVIDSSNQNKYVKVICLNHKNSYSCENRTGFTGRVIRRLDNKSTCSEDAAALKPDGSGNSYMAMGSNFYGPANYFITFKSDSTNTAQINVTSEYFYTQGGTFSGTKSVRTDSEGNYTMYGVKFENMDTTVKGASQIFNMDHVETSPSQVSRSYNTYIVYTLQ